jgi:hypothetical protein
MTDIPPPDAPIRQAAKLETLCRTCKRILRTDCRNRYQRQVDMVDNFVVVTQCSGYEEVQ